MRCSNVAIPENGLEFPSKALGDDRAFQRCYLVEVHVRSAASRRGSSTPTRA